MTVCRQFTSGAKQKEVIDQPPAQFNLPKCFSLLRSVFVSKQTHALHQQLANLKMRFHKLFVYSSIVGVTFLIGQ